MARIVTFGEIMARMAPPGVLRLSQVLPGHLDVTFAGAEANVAASLAMLGVNVDFVTALPDSPLTPPCLASLRSWGVGTEHILHSNHGRFGIYFVEMGANQRPTRVYYDRDHSAISLARPLDFDWTSILAGADWLHLTGITPALSETAAETTLHAARTASSLGVRVSCDINFRSRLWRWDAGASPVQLAGRVLKELLPFVDLLFGNEEDARLLGLPVSGDPRGSQQDRMVRVAETFAQTFPSIRMFATTIREQFSASHNNWSAMLIDLASSRVCLAPIKGGQFQPYEIRSIVDRVGSGDAFDAGILFGLVTTGFDLQSTLEFATASSCLAHSVSGDCNYASRSEIEELVHGAGTGRVVR